MYAIFCVAVIDVPLPTDLPLPCTIQYLATHYLDIQCVPRRYFFELLMNFTKSEMEKERLAEFCSADGQVSKFVYAYVILFRNFHSLVLWYASTEVFLGVWESSLYRLYVFLCNTSFSPYPINLIIIIINIVSS